MQSEFIYMLYFPKPAWIRHQLVLIVKSQYMIENVRERKGLELYKEVESNHSACNINQFGGIKQVLSPFQGLLIFA